MRGGTSADRQLAVYEKTRDLRAVVDRVVSETAEGVRPEISKRFAERVATGDPLRATISGESAPDQRGAS